MIVMNFGSPMKCKLKNGGCINHPTMFPSPKALWHQMHQPLLQVIVFQLKVAMLVFQLVHKGHCLLSTTLWSPFALCEEITKGSA